MLTSFRLHNFRTYLNTELAFSPRHLLIGRNNSGKTNLSRAMKFLSLTAAQDFNVASGMIPGGLQEIGNWRLRSDLVELGCTCKLSFQSDLCEFRYDLTLKLETSTGTNGSGQVELRVAKERLSLNAPGFKDAVLLENDGREAKMLHEEGHLRGPLAYIPKTLAPKNASMLSKLYELDNNRRAIAFRKYLAGWSYYSLNPEAMRWGWQGKASDSAGLWPAGDTLASVIYQLKNMDELKYRQVLNHVRMAEPSLEAFNFVPTGQTVVPFVALKDQPRASWVGMSDGTLRVIAIAYIVEASNFPQGTSSTPLSIIEEPENGVAPGLLRKVFGLFEERAAQAQFIFTTHSPYFIDFFDSSRDAVTVLRRNNERTECESPKASTGGNADSRLTLSEEYAAELVG